MLQFQIYKDSNEYHFRVADNDDVILLSREGVKQKDGILSTIAAVKKNAPVPTSIEKKETKDGYFYFTVTNSYGAIICTSTMFFSPRERDKWLNDIQKEIPQIDIVDS